ncbi:AbrB/MazE/SpoVT family DNA-binding domain-containing protein [Methylophilus sp.]|uniref:AbrB/MazE/SpoVT family DNA-binding domain-containing protein n=1 Tax=Methylophilus sp. TaxID=29541 RepID=UPI0011DC3ECC|nr:MAG: AbrB/MazE/SpoVT family DNA-binding domain-containing protein [Methylophilus sp.]
MRLKIQKWGNSAAIRLPRTLLSQIGATIGDVVEIDAKAFKLSRPTYKLDDLIAMCDINAVAPSDMDEWEMAVPYGHEKL